jgi:hypothetical protein
MSPQPSSDVERQVVDDVAKFGWHGVSRFPGGAEIDHYYTVGLQQTYGHPELVISELAGDIAHGMARSAVEAIEEGTAFSHGQRSDAILEGYDVAYAAIEPITAGRWLPLAAWYYEDRPWRALQLVWPDRAGRFPGQNGYDADRSPQELLSHRGAG